MPATLRVAGELSWPGALSCCCCCLAAGDEDEAVGLAGTARRSCGLCAGPGAAADPGDTGGEAAAL